MYQTLTTTIVGVAPLIMHNGQTADPLNQWAKDLKAVSGKRKKTEADLLELSRIEFMAGLYMDENGPVVPSVMLEAVISRGAAKAKNGRLAEAGVYVDKNASLQYIGPRTAAGLFGDKRFVLRCPAIVSRQKIMRTRPIFREWMAEVSIKYLEDIISEGDLLTALRAAGTYVGLGDWRPRNGRFALAEDYAASRKAA